MSQDLPHKPTREVLKRFFKLTLGWWKEKRAAWWLSFALAASLIINVGINYAVNRWNRFFFDALEKKDAATASTAIFLFLALVIAAAAIGVAIVRSRETLQTRWREWVILKLLDKWVVTGKVKTLQDEGKEPPNPEYRIADDTRMATEPIVDFAIGFISSVVSAATFVTVLWIVGGNIKLFGFNIYGYMVFAALFYALIMSSLMLYFGHKLPFEMAKRNEAEAKFRFELTRLRENPHNFEDKRLNLGETYYTVVQRWLTVVKRNANITWITNSNGVFIPVFPLLLAAPKYFSGELSLGEVTQLAGAFFQTQIAVAWLVDNFRAIAQCYASILRVSELDEAMEKT